MRNWQKIKIGAFLFERVGKYKPDNQTIAGLKRIYKIDFSGNFHIAIKPSRTSMILVEPGDFVISGIGIHNGSMGIYEGAESVTATIHYSSYTFDKEKINVAYFKRFLKSPQFVKLINAQVRGGMRPEIKPKHILPLEIDLPEIEEQRTILAHFKSVETEDSQLKYELTHQQTLLKKLRQQILQEAVEGKLTAGWRQQNPAVEPASELLKRIQAEKQQLIKDKKIKNQKPLTPVNKEEQPFDLPEGWEWCRLGEMSNYGQSFKIEPMNIKDSTWVLDLEDIEKSSSKLLQKVRYGEKQSQSTKSVFNVGDVLYGKLRPYLDKVVVADEPGICTTEIMPIQLFGSLNPQFIRYSLKRTDFLNYVNSQVSGMRMPRLKTESGRNAVMPLPPLLEQKVIVTRVEKLLTLCDRLETQITSNQNHAEQLMQAVLKEAFGATDNSPWVGGYSSPQSTS